MKTKSIFLFLILFGVSISVNAQLSGKKFQVKMGEMGTFNLEFKENTYVLSSPADEVLVLGNYSIEENTISFSDNEGPMACQKENVGKYKFSFTNKELKMEIIEDSCQGRPGIATEPWRQIEN